MESRMTTPLDRTAIVLSGFSPEHGPTMRPLRQSDKASSITGFGLRDCSSRRDARSWLPKAGMCRPRWSDGNRTMPEWRIERPDGEATPEWMRAPSTTSAAEGARSARDLWRASVGRARLSFRSGLRGLIGIVYPPSCIACQAATGEAQALCPACWRGIGFIERP